MARFPAGRSKGARHDQCDHLNLGIGGDSENSSYEKSAICKNKEMKTPILYADIKNIITPLKMQLWAGFPVRVPWQLYDLIWTYYRIIPSDSEHAGYFHATVGEAIALYSEDLARFVCDNEQAFDQYCKERGLTQFFQSKKPRHW